LLEILEREKLKTCCKIPIELVKNKNDTELIIKDDFNGDHDENSIDYLK
jgi:hypothetical protein